MPGLETGSSHMPRQADRPGRPDRTPQAGSSTTGDPSTSAAALAEFAARLSSLAVRFREVIGQMEQIAVTMREPGHPPDYRLVHALGDCHRQFSRLRHELLQMAATLGVKIRSTERLSGLHELEAFLGTLSETAGVELPPREPSSPVPPSNWASEPPPEFESTGEFPSPPPSASVRVPHTPVAPAPDRLPPTMSEPVPAPHRSDVG